MSLHSRRLIVLAAGAVVVLLVALTTMVGGVAETQPTITLTASRGESISPAGTVTRSIGSALTITIRPDDPAASAGLMVNGEPVPLLQRDGAFTYDLQVQGDEVVQATVARLADDVKTLDAATGALLQSVAANGSSVEFSGSSPLLDTLAPGDILANTLASGVNRPLLVKVVSIARVDGRVVLTTRPAAITEVVRDASVDITVPLTQPRRTGSIGPLRNTADTPQYKLAADMSAADQGIHAALDATLREGSCADLTCSLQVGGEVNIGIPTLDLGIDVDWFQLKGFHAIVEEHASASVYARAQVGAKGKATVEYGRYDYGVVIVPVGFILIWVTPGLDQLAGGDWDVGADIEVGADISVGARVGAQYENGQFATVWEPTTTATAHASVGGSGSLTVYPIFEPRVSVESVCDLTVDIQVPYLNLTVATNDDPWWTVYGGAAVDHADAQCAVLPKWEWDLGLGVRAKLLDAGGPFPAPPATAIATETPSGSAVPNPPATASPSATVTPTPAPTGGPTLTPSAAPSATAAPLPTGGILTLSAGWTSGGSGVVVGVVWITGHGFTPGGPVTEELVSPDGSKSLFSRTAGSDGAVKDVVPVIGGGSPAGVWRVAVTDTATGRRAAATFTVIR